MRGARLFLTCVVMAAIVPFAHVWPSGSAAQPKFPGWPPGMEGRALKPLPLSQAEERFANGFPGRLGKFTDGERVFLIRWVTGETRKLHPAADCFRGSGYSVQAGPLVRDGEGALWGSFVATLGQERAQVRERVFDGAGNSWTDVSSWYWAALLGRTEGPWWAVTAVETSRR